MKYEFVLFDYEHEVVAYKNGQVDMTVSFPYHWDSLNGSYTADTIENLLIYLGYPVYRLSNKKLMEKIQEFGPSAGVA